jgi:hypothetical protein
LKAKKTISDYFKNDNEPENLLQYLNAIEEKLEFNEFILIDGTEIGVVFETMNNRGINLSNLEIVKNRLLYLTSKVPTTNETKSELLELSNLINKKWSHILKNLTLANKVLDEDAFLNNHWIIFKGWSRDNSAKSEILDKKFTITEMINDPNKMAKEIRSYIHSLAETSLIWRHINYPEEPKSFSQIENPELRGAIVDILCKLNRISNSTVRPVILAFYPLLNSKPEFFYELCQLAEIYSFRLFSMNKKRSDTGKNDIYRKCNDFHRNFESVVYQKESLYFLSWYIDVHGDWRRFELEREELFSSTKKNGFYSWSGLSYFLYEFEEDLRKGQASKVEYPFANQSTKSIEHILPQTPTNAYWKDALTGIPKQEKKKLIHGLGNLLLIASEKNSQLKNSDYPVKIEGYKTGSYSENRVAKLNRNWGRAEIEKRESELLKFMKSRWRINERFIDKYPSPTGADDAFDDILDDTLDDVQD